MWPPQVMPTWIERGILTQSQFSRIAWNTANDKALESLMKTAPRGFYAFKFSTNENVITAFFSGGQFERLLVNIPPSEEFAAQIKSTTAKETWGNLDQLRDYYNTQGKTFEVQLVQPDF